MKNCLIIINQSAGSSNKISFDKVQACLGDEYIYTHCLLPKDDFPPFDKYVAIAICGGDGTLSSVLEKVYNKNIDIFYFPVGTLNDKAKAQRYEHAKSPCPTCDKLVSEHIVIGKCKRNFDSEKDAENSATLFDDSSNDDNKTGDKDAQHIFTYVLATGSFTPIGYTAKVRLKKKIGVLAYIFQVLKEYKPHKIFAKIQSENLSVEGDFTLIMFVKSPRCFGFNFNKAFDAKKESGHLVAIRTPKGKGMLKYIEMFFPFFRVFFVGLKEEMMTKNIIFKQISSAKIHLENDTDFCKDGEKLMLESGTYDIDFAHSAFDFSVIEKF